MTSPAFRVLVVLGFVTAGAAALLWWAPGAPEAQDPGVAQVVERDTGVDSDRTVAPARDGWTGIGHEGLDLGGFFQPRGIAGLPDGGFIVVDRKARVQRFDARGRAVSVWSMSDHALGNPKDIDLLPNGNLLVVDTHYGRVLEMTLDGAIARQWGDSGLEPGRFTHPIAVAVDLKRRVAYVAEYGAYNDRIQKFDAAGVLLKVWGAFGDQPGQMRRPSGLAVDPQGDLWVADSVNHRLQKFDPEGRLLGVYGEMGDGPGQLRFPYDLDCDSKGRIYVAEFGNHRVSVYNADGTFARHLGGPGDALGRFHCPWSLAVDDADRLLVSDTANHRVQTLDLSKAADGRVAKAPAANGAGAAHAR
ncbi:MAG: SMP-30/gluconolactonase/LRE family protein [Planctomycetota bacterium]|nr:SMP-30/gluconolactonase/LRE family protein [Planctomycetota bacterium]